MDHNRPRAVAAQTGSNPFSYRERVGFNANSTPRPNSPEELSDHCAEMRPPADAGVLTDRHGSSPSRQASSALGNMSHNCPEAAMAMNAQIRTETDRVRFGTVFHHSRKSDGPSYRDAAIRGYNTQTDDHGSPVRWTELKQSGSIRTTSARERLRFEQIRADPSSQTERVKLSSMVRRSRKINDLVAEKWRPACAEYADTCTTVTKDPGRM